MMDQYEHSAAIQKLPAMSWEAETIIDDVDDMKLVQALRWAKWDVRHMGCKHYALINPDGKETGWMIFGNDLTMSKSYSYTCVFQLSKCQLRIMPDEKGKKPEGYEVWNTVCVKPRGEGKNDPVFVLFHSSKDL